MSTTITPAQNQIMKELQESFHKKGLMHTLFQTNHSRFQELLDKIQKIHDLNGAAGLVPEKAAQSPDGTYASYWGDGGVMRNIAKQAGKHYPLDTTWMKMAAQAIQLDFSPGEGTPSFPTDHDYTFPVGELAIRGGSEGAKFVIDDIPKLIPASRRKLELGSDGNRLPFLMLTDLEDALKNRQGTPDYTHAVEAVEWIQDNHPEVLEAVKVSHPDEEFSTVDEIFQNRLNTTLQPA